MFFKGVMTQKWYILFLFFLLQYVANDPPITAGNLLCSSMRWLIIWRRFYSAQLQSQLQEVLLAMGAHKTVTDSPHAL